MVEDDDEDPSVGATESVIGVLDKSVVGSWIPGGGWGNCGAWSSLLISIRRVPILFSP
jgi:hypothetical protein